ncbi:MAG: S9 family peptidase [Myxococcales bacterium]|nr:S9 family peptidase [Myxococcales bacterium]
MTERNARPVLSRLRAAATTVALAAALTTTATPREALAQQPSAPRANADRAVRFRGRTIDLRPFYEGFPYLGFRVETRADRVLYFHDTPQGRHLLQLPLAEGTAPIDLERGERLGDIDWNRRSLRDLRYLPSRREYLVLADDANEERYNLFAMAADTGAIRRITDHDYVYGVGTNSDRTQIAYVPRHGQRAPYRSCLRVIDVATMQDREVVCDTPELTFTWTAPTFSPSGQYVIVNANRANDRKHQNLVLIDLTAPAPTLRVLTDIEQRRRNVSVLEDWVGDHSFVYTSDEDGFTNVYRMDLAPDAPPNPTPAARPTTAPQGARPAVILAPRREQLTRFTEDVDSLVMFEWTAPVSSSPSPRSEDEGRIVTQQARFKLIGATVKRPYESELFVIDPNATLTRTEPIVARRVFDATVVPLDYEETTAYFTTQSRRTSFSLLQVKFEPTAPTALDGSLVPTTRASVPESVARAIETCEVERVSIPTFDTDARTGRARTLHAYLHRPRNPWPDRAQRFALIQSFYGGENRWDTQAQILCAAGAIVLSPSVRGSTGFGADFAALNDHDLGGNEMFDLVHVARWLAQREDLRERQIGVYGGSHGGYAAMRALTMPEEVNGRRDRFDWGFGLSWFGFSNILTFYERCNIPDWVLLEAGDPRSERARLLDRSPISHVDRMQAPLLMMHGENDNRVPVLESRQMAEALRRARKRFVYEEFAGQGHGLKGIENQHRVWTAVFRFLERDALPERRRVPTSFRTTAKRAILPVVALAALLALCVGGALWARSRGGAKPD